VSERTFIDLAPGPSPSIRNLGSASPKRRRNGGILFLVAGVAAAIQVIRSSADAWMKIVTGPLPALMGLRGTGDAALEGCERRLTEASKKVDVVEHGKLVLVSVDLHAHDARVARPVVLDHLHFHHIPVVQKFQAGVEALVPPAPARLPFL
jgi:hypothetical protein